VSPDPFEHGVPRGVTVRWRDGYGAAGYRAAAPRRPDAIVVRPTRRGLTLASGAGVGGAVGAAWLVEYGVTHARSLAALAGASLAVIAGVLLDRIAPRFLNRTELRFTDDALEVHVRPLSDERLTCVRYADVAGFEVEEVVDPVAAPPVVLRQVNVRRRDGSVEPVVQGLADADAAAWIRSVLSAHAQGG
jgi:hypothetical protein